LRLHLYSPHPHRLGDVLDRLLAQVLVLQNQLVLDVFTHSPRDADASSVGQALQTGGDVDAITVDLFPLHNHIAQVDTNAELHSPVGWQLRIPSFEFALDLDRTLHGVHHAGELGEHTIACGANDSTALLLDEGVGYFPVGSQGAQRAYLILAHQAAVALDIGAEDGGEFAFDATRFHEKSLAKAREILGGAEKACH